MWLAIDFTRYTLLGSPPSSSVNLTDHICTYVKLGDICVRISIKSTDTYVHLYTVHVLHVCMYVHVWYVYARIWLCIWQQVQQYIHILAYAYIRSHANTCIRTYTYTYIHTYIHIHEYFIYMQYMHIQAYIHMRICVHIYVQHTYTYGMYTHVYARMLYVRMWLFATLFWKWAKEVAACQQRESDLCNELSKRYPERCKTALTFSGLEHPPTSSEQTFATAPVWLWNTNHDQFESIWLEKYIHAQMRIHANTYIYVLIDPYTGIYIHIRTYTYWYILVHTPPNRCLGVFLRGSCSLSLAVGWNPIHQICCDGTWNSIDKHGSGTMVFPAETLQRGASGALDACLAGGCAKSGPQNVAYDGKK